MALCRLIELDYKRGLTMSIIRKVALATLVLSFINAPLAQGQVAQQQPVVEKRDRSSVRVIETKSAGSFMICTDFGRFLPCGWTGPRDEVKYDIVDSRHDVVTPSSGNIVLLSKDSGNGKFLSLAEIRDNVYMTTQYGRETLVWKFHTGAFFVETRVPDGL